MKDTAIILSYALLMLFSFAVGLMAGAL